MHHFSVSSHSQHFLNFMRILKTKKKRKQTDGKIRQKMTNKKERILGFGWQFDSQTAGRKRESSVVTVTLNTASGDGWKP